MNYDQYKDYFNFTLYYYGYVKLFLTKDNK